MKAAVHTRYGPPDVVRVVDVPTPAPRENEVLVKVHATTVNRTDCGFRGAKPFFVRAFTGLVRPRVTILGNEFAGQVQAIGSSVTSFAVGDRVFGYDDTACGAHAQYLTIREDASLARIPAEPDLRTGCPGHRRLPLRPRDHRKGEDSRWAACPRQRRDRGHRLCGDPAAGESRCARNRGLRHHTSRACAPARGRTRHRPHR